MKTRGIGFKLTAVMLCVILLGILITAGVATIISGNVITSESLNKVKSETEKQALIMDEWLVYHKAVVATLAATLSQVSDHSKENLYGILSEALVRNGVYQDVYIGFADDTAVMGSGYPIEEAYAEGWRATGRDWYQLALTDTNNAAVTSPYVDTATRDLCITAVHAVKREGIVIGVVGIDIMVNIMQDIVFAATLDETGYSMLLDTNGDILIHPVAEYAPNEKGEYKNLASVRSSAYSGLWRQISAADGAYKYKDADNVQKYYNATTLGSTGWKMVTVLPESVVTQPIRGVIYVVVPIAVVILALAALLIYYFVTSMISKPLTALASFMKKAGSTGDITLSSADVENIGRLSKKKDEIGQAVNGSVGFVGHVTNIANDLETISDGDLTVDVKLLSEADTMGKSMKNMVDKLNSMFAEIQSSTDQVSTGSKQVADGAQSLAQGSTEQAASIDELSSSIAEIAERTKTNARTAERTAKLSTTIKENAEKGSRQMDEMILAVNEINEASRNISRIIKTIDDIAFQTNILALNAAVEAARAGQHGKGFAVVAEEVRNLASKSAEAAKDTGGMIQNSMEKAELGSRIAGETAESLKWIVSGINESNQLVAEIAKSSEEQSLGISHINTGIDQVAQVVQQNSATAEESAAASEEMSGQSDMLQQLIGQFKLKESAGSHRNLPTAERPDRKRLAAPKKTAYATESNNSFGKY